MLSGGSGGGSHEGWILRHKFFVQWTILEVIRCFRVQKQWILEFESAFHSSKHGLPLSKPQFRTQFPTQKYANHPAVIGNGHFNSSHRWGHSFGGNRFSKWNLEFSLQSYLRINQMCNYTCRSSFERTKEVPPQRNPPLPVGLIRLPVFPLKHFTTTTTIITKNDSLFFTRDVCFFSRFCARAPVSLGNHRILGPQV